jgi:hypothetical protein
MPMPFDATMKNLAAAFPRDFVAAFSSEPSLPVAVLNVDLSTVTTSADFVAGVGEPPAEVVHIDFQSAAMEGKHADVLAYNALLHRKYRVPVHSVVLLLRPSAAHSNLSGAVSYTSSSGRGRMQFEYEVVRLWERPAEEMLAGPLGIAPLAMLGRLPSGVNEQEGLTGIAQQLIHRMEAEANVEQARNLLTAAFVLTGMRVPRTVGRQVFAGVQQMRESDTFMAIIDEGREIEARRMILRLAQKSLGQPDEQHKTRLEGITDIERLERIHDRATEAPSWDDLLTTP